MTHADTLHAAAPSHHHHPPTQLHQHQLQAKVQLAESARSLAHLQAEQALIIDQLKEVQDQTQAFLASRSAEQRKGLERHVGALERLEGCQVFIAALTYLMDKRWVRVGDGGTVYSQARGLG